MEYYKIIIFLYPIIVQRALLSPGKVQRPYYVIMSSLWWGLWKRTLVFVVSQAHWSRNCQVHSTVLGAVETHKYGITCAFTSLHLPTLIGSVMCSIPTDLFQAVSFVPPAPQAVSYNKTGDRFKEFVSPSLTLFDFQKKSEEDQIKLTKTARAPHPSDVWFCLSTC